MFPYLCLAREQKNDQSPIPLDIRGQKQERMKHSRRVSRSQTLNPEWWREERGRHEAGTRDWKVLRRTLVTPQA